MTNGKDIYFLDAGQANKCLVAGFFSPDDLERLLYIGQNQAPPASAPVNTEITNRAHQIEAIRRVAEAFEQGKRRTLLVMATGTGKTRTAMSLVDILLRTNQARKVLFVADRDALFNPGMSGGALVNARGEVIGINTASIMEAQGINLAIGSDTAKKIAAQLIAGGVKRPKLGIAGERTRLYEGLVKHHKLDVTHGILVQGVEENSGAAVGGVKKGDILVGLDDKSIQGIDDLHRPLADYQAGDEVTLVAIRDLELLKLKVKLSSDE